MKRITKILIVLLAICMLLPCIASCKDNNKKTPPSGGNQTTTPSNGGNTTTTPADDSIEMPEKVDMEGYIYKAYVRDHAGTSPDAHNAQVQNGNNDYRCVDFWVDEANSEQDFISYAVYNRNKMIEADYNCKIRQVASNGSQIEHLLASFTNGDGYDLTIITAKPAAQAATQNLLQDLNSTDEKNLELNNQAFDQNAINELSVGDKLYFISGDMNISTMDVAGLSIVNMDFYADIVETIIEAYKGDTTYSDIYNIVLSNKWTMETLLKIAELANIDAGQDGGELHVLPNGIGANQQENPNKYPGGDTVGYHQYLYSALWYYYGSGGRITVKGDDGLPTFVIQENLGQTLYDYIFEKFNRKINTPWIPHESSNILNMNFLTGDVLFADCSLFNVRTEIYPRAEFEYGILPIPVYEEGMDYKSVVYFNNWAHLWAIPNMVGEQEYAERMMQIMAVYSSLPDSTMHAYYDRTIYFQAAADNGSRPVMDIIRTSLVYDLALLYPAWGKIEEKLYQIPNREASEYTDITSGISRSEEAMLGTIEQLLNPDMGA